MRLALVVLLLLPACMRGCPANGRAEPCHDTSECDDPAVCHRGYCVGEDYVRADDTCRQAPRCRETGACTAVTKRSFLGLDSGLECAATLEDDCRASTMCKTHGRCSRAGALDVGCVAPNQQACRASERCASREECEHDKHECVRRWDTCPPLPDVPAGGPEWATAEVPVIDFAKLGDAWSPGAVDSAIVACRIAGRGRTRSVIRIADRCTPGPTLDRKGTGTFLRAGVRLAPGDAITAAVQDDAIGRAQSSSYAKVTYAGESPMRAGETSASPESSPESIECRVVAPEAARARGREQLAALDKELVKAAREQLDPAHPRVMSHAVESARIYASRAATWLGWSDPELAARVPKIDAAARVWRDRLDAAFAKLARTATDATRPTSGRRMTVQPQAVVCGEALRDRYGKRATHPIADDECALEVVIANLDAGTMHFRTGTAEPVFELRELRWLRPTRAANPVMPWTWRHAEVMEAFAIDIRADEPGASPREALELAPGKRAILLVGGAREDLQLAAGGLDRRALLVGRIAFDSRFALRATVD